MVAGPAERIFCDGFDIGAECASSPLNKPLKHESADPFHTFTDLNRAGVYEITWTTLLAGTVTPPIWRLTTPSVVSMPVTSPVS